MASLDRHRLEKVTEIVPVKLEVSLSETQRRGASRQQIEIRLQFSGYIERSVPESGKVHSKTCRDGGHFYGRVVPDVVAFQIYLLVVRNIIKQVLGVGLGVASVENGARAEKAVWFKMIGQLHQMALCLRW